MKFGLSDTKVTYSPKFNWYFFFGLVQWLQSSFIFKIFQKLRAPAFIKIYENFQLKF